MDIVFSPSGIVNVRRPGQGITDIARAGFERISLNIGAYCSGYELEHFGAHQEERKLSSCFGPLIEQCQKQRLALPIARGARLLRETKRADLNGLLFQLHEESIALCGQAGCRYIIIPPLFAGIAGDAVWEENRRFYLKLAETARAFGIMILLENQCRSVGGHLVRGICAEGDAAAEWVDALNEAAGEERFGFCMDTGVLNLCGQDMQAFSQALGERIKAVVLRDCDGHNESAMLPFTAAVMGRPQTDWLGLIRGLREICFDGSLLLDMEDTAASFSPLLRPQLLMLGKAVADYMKWQLEMERGLKRYRNIVLFGAGNMCRNYMKCYGEQYPPLFTCDNNRSLWGTYFCGLAVRSPEALKDLPQDCVVIICNIYYREIEEQLLALGVQNISYFNDEYMPSFYFDRLKEG